MREHIKRESVISSTESKKRAESVCFQGFLKADAFMFTGNQEEERIDDEQREDVFIRKLRIRRVQWNGPDL